MNALRQSEDLRSQFLEAVNGVGDMGFAWKQVIPGVGEKGSSIANAWCAAIKPRLSRMGSWLPDDQGLEKYVLELRNSLPKEVPHQTSVSHLRILIQKDPILNLLLCRTVQEAKRVSPKKACADSIDELLKFLDYLITTAPSFNEYGLVGCPINAILDTSMATRHGYSLFRYPPFNEALGRILRQWGDFLNSSNSISTLNDRQGGWLTEKAKQKIQFDQYEIPKEGFKSWNEFFTRKLKPDTRPIYPNKNFIVSPADSTKYSLARDVKLDSPFWIKSEPYSLRFLFKDLITSQNFVGGDVYQAFLNAYSYHRWHAPYKGIIRDIQIVQGLYYSQTENISVFDPAAPDLSQGYISHCAARGIILIEAPKPIGLYAFIPVGMAEISSIIWSDKLKIGDKVKKGQELGHFSFGGSSYCLVFSRGVISKWLSHDNKMIKVGEQLAEISLP